MSRFRPSELQEYLRQIGAKPIKGMSQNFLIDGNILQKIITLADCRPGDLVFEIGPGPGALTERLLETGCEVVAIEKDATFARALHSMQHERLTVFEADALTFDFAGECNRRSGKAKVVANLPYHITTPILHTLLPLESSFTSITVMVQDEVARRLCLPCSVKDFVAFTLFLQYYSQPRYGFVVSPHCFYPAPRVHSAVIRLDLEKRYPVQDEAHFFECVDAAFSQRRKMIKATLKPWYAADVIERALEQIQKASTSRPEELSLQEWVTFYSTVNSLAMK